jgi:hypothetical protein
MREIVLRSGEPMTIENSYRFYRRPRRAGIRRSLHKLWIRAPHVTAQIAGRLQPKRIARKNDVNRDQHHAGRA